MFDIELASVVAIFAGIAALIAYINERTKRKINTSGQPFKLKKMPGKDATSPQGSDLEEWNFPQSTDEIPPIPSEVPPPRSAPVSIAKSTPGASASSAPIPAYASASFNGPNYKEIVAQPEHTAGRTPKERETVHPRLGNVAQLREAIVTMTILGPCRALAPFKDRE